MTPNPTPRPSEEGAATPLLAAKEEAIADAKADAENQREEVRKFNLIKQNYKESCVRLEAKLTASEARVKELEDVLRAATADFTDGASRRRRRTTPPFVPALLIGS